MECEWVRTEGIPGITLAWRFTLMPNSRLSLEQKRAIFALLGYLGDHPEAKDTLAGILKYWLPSDGPKPSAEELEDALDHLVQRGLLTRSIHRSSEHIYGLNKHHLAQIMELL